MMFKERHFCTALTSMLSCILDMLIAEELSSLVTNKTIAESYISD